MKRIMLSIFLFSLIPNCLADYDRAWLELGKAFLDSENVRFKIGDRSWGWAFSYSRFVDSGFFSSYNDKQSGEKFTPAIKTVAISRFFSGTFGWGYADVGAGLAYGKGTWADNCEPETFF